MRRDVAIASLDYHERYTCLVEFARQPCHSCPLLLDAYMLCFACFCLIMSMFMGGADPLDHTQAENLNTEATLSIRPATALHNIMLMCLVRTGELLARIAAEVWVWS